MNFKKNTWIFILSFVFIGCNSDAISDCIQNAGTLERETVVVPDFTRITVFENVQLILREGEEQLVEIETGRFLRDEVSAIVEDGRLLLRDENTCNFVRDFGLTTVYITAPNITEIRSSTGMPIQSDGILRYPSLNLISENFLVPEAVTTDGSFDLQLETESVAILTNGVAFFQLRGTTTNFMIRIAAGDSRIEASELLANNITVDHRGSNDMLVHPLESISGVIRGNGDVISSNRPDSIDVEEIFDGRLVFRE